MGKKILIVDDSAAARMFLKACIPTEHGYLLFEATDGEDAVSKYREVRPDITFLDLTMPELDGYGVLQKIRDINNDAVVVVLSSNIQKKSVERVKDAGAFDFIHKPPTNEKIHGVLEKIKTASPQAG